MHLASVSGTVMEARVDLARGKTCLPTSRKVWPSVLTEMATVLVEPISGVPKRMRLRVCDCLRSMVTCFGNLSVLLVA